MNERDYLESTQIAEEQIERERLEMSNARLIAELGRIAQALGCELSTVACLNEIGKLQALVAQLETMIR